MLLCVCLLKNHLLIACSNSALPTSALNWYVRNVKITKFASFTTMAALTNVTGQQLVTGFAGHNFSDDYRRGSAARSLPGLKWRLRALIHENQFNNMLHPTLNIQFGDEEENTQDFIPNTVCSAKVKLSVLLTNGQLVAEREDKVRHRFQGTQFYINGNTNPELNNFIGQQGQLLCESFIVQADIEVHGEPTILGSPRFEHAIRLDESCQSPDDGDRSFYVSGYQHCSRRLVFWMVTDRKVECWAVNPLVPSSQELLRLRPNHSTPPVQDDARAALSNDQHLAACVTRIDGRSYNFYVLLLDTNEMKHRRYTIQNEEEYDADLEGLEHTRRGWIILTDTGRFYRLEKEMELILRVEDVRMARGANYNWLLAWNEDRIQVWDLGSPELSSKSYDHQLNHYCSLLGHREEIFALERDGILSKIELEGDERRVQILCGFSRHFHLYFAFDQGKVVLVNLETYMECDSPIPIVQTVWMPGQIPTAKEMATMEIQKRTGTQELMQTATGARSVWRGGLTEQETRKILRALVKPCCHQPIDIIN